MPEPDKDEVVADSLPPVPVVKPAFVDTCRSGMTCIEDYSAVSTLIKRNKVFPGTILFPVKELTLNFADKINMLLYSIPAR